MENFVCRYARAVGFIHSLGQRWDILTLLGPDYGYYPNLVKSWVVTKDLVNELGYFSLLRNVCEDHLFW